VKVFVVMPFAPEFDRVFSAIKSASDSVSEIQLVRGDEIEQPGPIINQIMQSISDADVIVAEVGSRNPNVYYEVALAHCVQKPAILIADRRKIDEIPFDLRHNRVIAYDKADMAGLAGALSRSLSHIKETLAGDVEPSLEEVVHDTSSGSLDIDGFVKDIGKAFGFRIPRLQGHRYLEETGGFLLKIEDEYSGEKANAIYDRNGLLREQTRLN